MQNAKFILESIVKLVKLVNLKSLESFGIYIVNSLNSLFSLNSLHPLLLGIVFDTHEGGGQQQKATVIKAVAEA